MLALFQGLPEAASKRANIATIETMAASAASAGAALIVFPELFLTGYNIGRPSLWSLAEPLDGQSVAAIAEIAKSNAIGIIFGMPERDGARVFNAAVAMDASGAVVGRYRKIHLFGAEEAATFSAGETVCVVAIDRWSVGLAICYDIEFPEMARAFVRSGADLIAVPTANMEPYREVPTTLVRARALENGVGVLYANLAGQEGSLTYTGMSCIVGPDGRDLARAGMEGQALLCCSAAAVTPGGAGRECPSTQLHDLRADILAATSAS